jgi:hypothetical protein
MRLFCKIFIMQTEKQIRRCRAFSGQNSDMDGVAAFPFEDTCKRTAHGEYDIHGALCRNVMLQNTDHVTPHDGFFHRYHKR